MFCAACIIRAFHMFYKYWLNQTKLNHIVKIISIHESFSAAFSSYLPGIAARGDGSRGNAVALACDAVYECVAILHSAAHTLVQVEAHLEISQVFILRVYLAPQ